MDRIPLNVLGLSYSQHHGQAYALILAQADGPIRIPVVIGPAEAQSIAMRMENVVPPRPMTHDLFANFARAFGIALVEVFIYRFEDGIFSSEMTFSDGAREVKIDARTSDAIAMAMRTGAPIYTTRDVMERTGFVMAEEGDTSAAAAEEMPVAADPTRPETLSIAELEKMLEQHIEHEEYEQAAKISEILRQKRDNQ